MFTLTFHFEENIITKNKQNHIAPWIFMEQKYKMNHPSSMDILKGCPSIAFGRTQCQWVQMELINVIG
jgi:hypothetical protein